MIEFCSFWDGWSCSGPAHFLLSKCEYSRTWISSLVMTLAQSHISLGIVMSRMFIISWHQLLDNSPFAPVNHFLLPSLLYSHSLTILLWYYLYQQFHNQYGALISIACELSRSLNSVCCYDWA